MYINDLLKSTDNAIHSFADESTFHSTYCYFLQNSEVRKVERGSTVPSIKEDLCRIVQYGEDRTQRFITIDP